MVQANEELASGCLAPMLLAPMQKPKTDWQKQSPSKTLIRPLLLPLFVCCFFSHQERKNEKNHSHNHTSQKHRKKTPNCSEQLMTPKDLLLLLGFSLTHSLSQMQFHCSWLSLSLSPSLSLSSSLSLFLSPSLSKLNDKPIRYWRFGGGGGKYKRVYK